MRSMRYVIDIRFCNYQPVPCKYSDFSKLSPFCEVTFQQQATELVLAERWRKQKTEKIF